MSSESINPLECSICLNIFQNPVILPCSHNICKSHETDAFENNEITCKVCNTKHTIPETGFTANLLASLLLKANLNKGVEHTTAVELVDEFQELVDEIRLLKNNPSGGIRKLVEELREKITSKQGENAARADKLIKEIDEYEKKCLSRFEFECKGVKENETWTDLTHDKNKDDNELDLMENQCKSWRKELRGLENNIKRWMEIQTECKEKVKKLGDEQEKAKILVFNDQIYDLKVKQEIFSNPAVTPLL